MGVILQVTNGEISHFSFDVCRSVAAVQLTICKLLSFSEWEAALFLKLIISWSKSLKIDQFFNGKIF